MPETSFAALEAAGLMDRMYRRQRHIYDLTRKFYLLGRDELIDRLAPPADAGVLEIGCGTGRNLIRAARRYPRAYFYGLDVSAEMLATARAEIRRAGLQDRVSVAQGDATAFDPRALFGRDRFERVFVSYALSMIPRWQDALERAHLACASRGTLMVVDFGDCAGLPGAFRAALRIWLAGFGVHPREALADELAAFARKRGLALEFAALYRSYALFAALRA